jgi:hypothetical protein
MSEIEDAVRGGIESWRSMGCDRDFLRDDAIDMAGAVKVCVIHAVLSVFEMG